MFSLFAFLTILNSSSNIEVEPPRDLAGFSKEDLSSFILLKRLFGQSSLDTCPGPTTIFVEQTTGCYKEDTDSSNPSIEILSNYASFYFT